jgi:hypothetical protein
MRVLLLYEPWQMIAEVKLSPALSLRVFAVPPVAPWVKVWPEARVRETASRREAPRRVMEEALGEEMDESYCCISAIARSEKGDYLPRGGRCRSRRGVRLGGPRLGGCCPPST